MGGSAIKQERGRTGHMSLSRLCGTLACQFPWTLLYIGAVSGARAGAAHGAAWTPHPPLGTLIQRLLLVAAVVESLQLQMGFSFPFLCANDLRSSLLIIRARSFLLSFT